MSAFAMGPMRPIRHRGPPWASSPSSPQTTSGALPAGHFLSRASIALATDDQNQTASARPDLTTLASADFDVDVRSGFLPPVPPCVRLPPGPWQVWEEAWDASEGIRAGQGEGNAKTRQWRRAVREGLPVVDAEPLSASVDVLRRAHCVLACLAHAYVHSQEPGVEEDGHLVPRGIAVPLCAVSRMLDVPPVLSYADTVLYNWRLKVPELGLTSDNVEMVTTFTRSESEQHFFKTSLLIETLGPACLGVMRGSLDEAFLGDSLSISRTAAYLTRLASLVRELTKIVESMRQGCDPRVFYWEIRPWFNGGNWIMEGVVDQASGEWLRTDFGGPSAGQSTLVHSLDVFLGVDHRPRPDPASAGEPVAPSKEETFMSRMAAYMPHHHRRFLEHLVSTLPRSDHPIRTLATVAGPSSPLFEAYNAAVGSLESLRQAHSRIALLYIVSQSRVEPPEGSAFLGQWRAKLEDDARRAAARIKAGEAAGEQGAVEVHKGTGGSDLAVFLKRCRERTREAVLRD